MFINLFDSHTHSENSFDADHSVTFMCEKAIEAGISGICVTDHCELKDYQSDRYDMRMTQAVFDVNKAKRVFNGRLAVMAGVELSDVLFDRQLTERVLEQFPFDMVIISQHNSAQGEDIYYSNFSEWTAAEIDAYLSWYFSYLLKAAEWGKFDTFGHLTYPLRYITGRHQIQIDLSRYEDQIDQILRTVAQTGRAIEINTSGLSQPLGDTMPGVRYVKRYRELGGEYITLGSDAHSAEAIGRGIDTAMQMLLDAGFSYFTFYKQRQPLQLKII